MVLSVNTAYMALTKCLDAKVTVMRPTCLPHLFNFWEDFFFFFHDLFIDDSNFMMMAIHE